MRMVKVPAQVIICAVEEGDDSGGGSSGGSKGSGGGGSTEALAAKALATEKVSAAMALVVRRFCLDCSCPIVTPSLDKAAEANELDV